jgi:hypothetical protein
VNTASLITKGLRFRPQRTLFLLLGFAVGVMVMVVLLSVGSAVLDQAMDEDLTGGGDVVLLPVGIDVSVLKTGGVTSLHFDIPNARLLTREILSPRRLRDVVAVSPELTRAYATLAHGGRERLIRADGVVPSRFAALWPAMPAAFTDGEGERAYLDPDLVALLREVDAFHRPVVDTSQTWAEWHYFNYHDGAGRSLYVSISALAWEGELTASGYSRGMVLVEFVDDAGRQLKLVDSVDGRDVAASIDSPDLRVGSNTVRLDGGVYRVHAALADSLGRPVRVVLDLVPSPHLVVPPLTPMGAEVPFGYVVPVVRGPMTGRLSIGGRVVELDGTGYHDHNWGHFRDAAWDWGIVHAGEFSVLYGRFATSAAGLVRQPVLVALFDGQGPRPFVLTARYSVTWAPNAGEPRAIDVGFASGADSLHLRIDVDRRFVSETGGGEQPLFRADERARSFFYQMEGRATLRGGIDGLDVDERGHAYAETFRTLP